MKLAHDPCQQRLPRSRMTPRATAKGDGGSKTRKGAFVPDDPDSHSEERAGVIDEPICGSNRGCGLDARLHGDICVANDTSVDVEARQMRDLRDEVE